MTTPICYRGQVDIKDSSHRYPGELGRVASAWVKSSKNALALEKPIYGHSPAVIFEERVPRFMDIATIDTPTGMAAPEAGFYWTEEPDGTPVTRRHLSFTPPATRDDATGGGSRCPVVPSSAVLSVGTVSSPISNLRVGDRSRDDWTEIQESGHKWRIPTLVDAQKLLKAAAGDAVQLLAT
jgi:hypothetical protein